MNETQRPRNTCGLVVKKDIIWMMILVQLQLPEAQILINVKDCVKAAKVCYYLLRVSISS